MATSTLGARQAKSAELVRLVPKHHTLVCLSHWLNVPLLLGLIASGLSIYWAAPVFQHPPDPVTQSRDYLVDLGTFLAQALHERWRMIAAVVEGREEPRLAFEDGAVGAQAALAQERAEHPPVVGKGRVDRLRRRSPQNGLAVARRLHQR